MSKRYSKPHHVPSLTNNSKIFCRYRPVYVANDKSIVEELINQEIYLASRDCLNDPMEDVPLFSWEADESNWAVLLKHYLLSLASAWTAACESDDKIEFSDHIILEQPNHAYPDRYDGFLTKVFSSEIIKLYDILGKSGVVSTEELVFILSQCQWKMIKLLLDWHRETGGSHNIDIPEELTTIEFDSIQRILTCPDKNVLINLAKKQCTSYLTVSFLMNGNDTPAKTKNFHQILTDFPRCYFEQIGKKRSDMQFRVASFFCSEDLPNDFLMWSHYADRHKGVCLIFNAPIDAGGAPGLKVNKESVSALVALKEVMYDSNVPIINAFDSVDLSILVKRACFKLPVWSAENEYRIVESDSKDQESIIYDFSSLSGVVFGVNTPQDIKDQMMRVIREKCKENGRVTFSIYQSFLSSSDGKLTVELIMNDFPG